MVNHLDVHTFIYFELAGSPIVKLGIRANSEYLPFYYTDWQSFLVNGNLRTGFLLPCFDSILRKYIFFLRFAKKTIQCLLGINVRGFRKFNKV